MSLIQNQQTSLLSPGWRHYLVALGMVFVVSLLDYWLQKWTGYEALALMYLLAVVLLALMASRGATLFGAVLSAASWNFLFVPPRYSFHIEKLYDKMMLATYIMVAFIVTQLTVRLREQHDAEIQAKLLGESERLGRTLLSSVSHELRTPISAIITAADGLRADRTLSTSQQQLVTEIESAGSRLNRVVQSLLSAARLRAGQVRPNLDWCDVRDVIRAALRESSEITAGHPLETRIASDLRLVKMDSVLMQQALSNLLANAAIHTPPETPIEISARMEQNQLLLQVADRGPGLAGAEIERIFDLFHRAPNARPGGTGLGLAIVKGFVEAQGGRVQAANASNGGALFSIFLPASESPALKEEAT